MPHGKRLWAFVFADTFGLEQIPIRWNHLIG